MQSPLLLRFAAAAVFGLLVALLLWRRKSRR